MRTVYCVYIALYVNAWVWVRRYIIIYCRFVLLTTRRCLVVLSLLLMVLQCISRPWCPLAAVCALSFAVCAHFVVVARV